MVVKHLHRVTQSHKSKHMSPMCHVMSCVPNTRGWPHSPQPHGCIINTNNQHWPAKRIFPARIILRFPLPCHFWTEVASLRPDHLPTLSADKTSTLSLLIKSTFCWRNGRCRQCYTDFLLQCAGDIEADHTDSGIVMDCVDQNREAPHLGDWWSELTCHFLQWHSTSCSNTLPSTTILTTRHMSILPHTACLSQLIHCFIQSQQLHQVHNCLPIIELISTHYLYPHHGSLTIKITISFSLWHNTSLRYWHAGLHRPPKQSHSASEETSLPTATCRIPRTLLTKIFLGQPQQPHIFQLSSQYHQDTQTISLLTLHCTTFFFFHRPLQFHRHPLSLSATSSISSKVWGYLFQGATFWRNHTFQRTTYLAEQASTWADEVMDYFQNPQF